MRRAWGPAVAVALVAAPVAMWVTRDGRDLKALIDAPTTSASVAPSTVASPVVAGASGSMVAGDPTAAGSPGDTAAPAADAVVARPQSAVVGKPVSFSIVAAGDILPHKTMLTRLQRENKSLDIDGTMEEIRPFVSKADLAICHLEGALLAPGEPIRPYYILGMPPVWLREVKRAGWDTCSTASNHSLDGGAAGVDATVDEFAKLGMHQAGVASSADTVLPELLTIKGVRVAHLAYTYGFDHGKLPKGEPWRANQIKVQRIIDDAKEMRRRGAEVVIVSMHWGNTQWAKLSSFQLSVGEAITKSGQIDLIVGHHSHLIQPISQVHGVWVLWGLSNLLSNHPVNKGWGPATQDGVIAQVTIRRTEDGSIVVDRPVAYPTWCDKAHDYRVHFVDPAMRAANLPKDTVAGLDLSWRRTTRVLGDFIAKVG